MGSGRPAAAVADAVWVAGPRQGAGNFRRVGMGFTSFLLPCGVSLLLSACRLLGVIRPVVDLRALFTRLNHALDEALAKVFGDVPD